jgi:hypothetical protein
MDLVLKGVLLLVMSLLLIAGAAHFGVRAETGVSILTGINLLRLLMVAASYFLSCHTAI